MGVLERAQVTRKRNISKSQYQPFSDYILRSLFDTAIHLDMRSMLNWLIFGAEFNKLSLAFSLKVLEILPPHKLNNSYFITQTVSSVTHMNTEYLCASLTLRFVANRDKVKKARTTFSFTFFFCYSQSALYYVT